MTSLVVIPSSPLECTHDPTTLGLKCYHKLLTGDTIRRPRAWDDLMSFGSHTRSDDSGRGMLSSPFEAHVEERHWA